MVTHVFNGPSEAAAAIVTAIVDGEFTLEEILVELGANLAKFRDAGLL